MRRYISLLLFIGLGLGQDDCTADDGTDGVELWGTCYSIENTTSISLPNYSITGGIPPEIGNLTNLTHLTLRNNELTGSIPPEIGNLTNLTDLRLYDNQLTGEIPPEIGNLTNLTELELFTNQLSGSIPSEIGNLTNLTYLSLSNNQLTGEIPPEIGNLTNLISLSLSNNQLTGEIPIEICNLNIGEMTFFTIYNNQFCPSYPSCIEGNVGEQDLTNCLIYVLYPTVSDTFSSHIDSNTGIVFTWDKNNLNYYPTYRLTIELEFFGNTFTDVYDNISDTIRIIPANNLDALLGGLNITETALSWYVDAYDEDYSIASDTGQFVLSRSLLGTINNQYDFVYDSLSQIPNVDVDAGTLHLFANFYDGTTYPPNPGNGQNFLLVSAFDTSGANVQEEIVDLIDVGVIIRIQNGDGSKVQSFTADAATVFGDGRIMVQFNTATFSYFSETGIGFSHNESVKFINTSATVYIDKELESVMSYTLYPNYPNPFNPVTTLRYDLPENANVNITIYDMMGRQVKALLNGSQTAGYKSIQWNATNDEGKPVSAGLYLYTIEAGEFRQTKKMVLLK
jgi:hypothetical protein